MRYTGPRNRIARREGLDLGLKTPGSKSQATLLKKLNVLPGQHGTRGRRKVSEHGRQLREKQKLRFMYGVTETQLKNYFARSIKKTGNTALYMTQFLERRLDTIVNRLGFVPTRAAARQLIVHKHIKVNNRIVNTPSYQVRIGDVVTLANDKILKLPIVESSLNKADTIIPTWLDRQGPVGKIITEPNAETLEKQINLRLVIEFYSR